MAYTYNDLARDIAALTPEQRAQAVRFLEPYDDGGCLGVTEIGPLCSDISDDEEIVAHVGDVVLS